MNAVGFLLIVVVISVLGSLWVWYRQRRPTTLMSSVDDFQREMEALARDRHDPSGRPGRHGRHGKKSPTQPILPPDTAEERARRLRDARRPPGRREG